MRETEFEFIRGLVYRHSRINLGADKRELVSARLGKRLRATRLPSIGAYCQLLQAETDGNELAHLIDEISTNHTFFFREIAHFEFLTRTALPELRARLPRERWPAFQIWSAACSSGEEPYSIAMALEEGSASAWPWRIECTDISHRILARAQAGIYREEAVAKLPPERSRRFFDRGHGPQEGNYRVKAALRARLGFQQLNLLEGEPPFAAPFQVIFCRNVMIYFDRKTQAELVQKLTRHLVPGGYLFVGHSESLTGIPHTLQAVRPAIYRRAPHP
ncbi:MAG: protein-glutamate O-methyltransferase CheR [Opitutae bacterium]|nr:protein-glutamate O-methyltransferase CheR [Opitutae bacterium]